MRTLKLTVEYDGSGYHGWQRQDGSPTVQQTLEECISLITLEKVKVTGSGRTDAGVHALNQTAHFKTDSSIGTRNLLLGINSLLPDDVVIKCLEEMVGPFHARFDAKSKIYKYQIFNNPIRSALYRNYAWHIRVPLDLSDMEKGLSLLKGCHDFSSFCGKKEREVNCVRTVKDAGLMKTGDGMISLSIEADGFLRYMVRSIVGTLVEIGKGKIKPEALRDILEARDRSRAGMTAPPQGLYLVEVKY